MNMTEFEGYRYVDGGVCAAQGFQANGLNCGLNPDKNKNDLGMVLARSRVRRQPYIHRIR